MIIKPYIHRCIVALITPLILSMLFISPAGQLLAVEKTAYTEAGLFLDNPEKSYSLNGNASSHWI